MMNFSSLALNDFRKAKKRAKLQTVLSKLQFKNSDLLSWYEVTSIIKPKSETYLGMRTIPVDRIIGSEGRFQDFSSAFMPKREALKARWTSVDCAIKQDIILPPISVFSLGGWYFVRDGNHRVSVAKATGGEFIDAEVVELDSKIPLEQGLTAKEIKRRVVSYERELFISQHEADLNLPMDEIYFSSPGAYSELYNHILVHKYYINQEYPYELPLKDAAKSWYDNVYKPIRTVILQEKLLAAFPGATVGDAYLWLVKYWDELKRANQDQSISVEKAAEEVEKKASLINKIKRQLLCRVHDLKRRRA